MRKIGVLLRDIPYGRILFITIISCFISLFLSQTCHADITTHTVSTVISHQHGNVFFSVIHNPTVAYLLILLGIYGVFFELLHPGLILPGAVGVLSLLIALYAFQLLPINYNGLGLIVLGIAFIISEGFTPSFGILGLAGTILFVIGSTWLMNSGQTQIAWTAIAAMGLVNLLLFVFLAGVVLRSRKQRVKNGLVMLIGATGRSLGEINLEGQAVIRGEIWSVNAQSPIAADKPVKVVNALGLKLEVVEDHSWN